VLRIQRQAIEEKQALLERAVRAIRAAEESLASGKPADPVILRKIIEAIDMQQGIEVMKKYYSEEAWARHRNYYENGPAPEWVELYRDIDAAPGADPASPEAQALADRWLQLQIRAWTGDSAVQTDSPSAWLDCGNWPPAMKQRIAQYNVEAVAEFIKQAAMCARRKYFSEAGWARFVELRQEYLADPAERSVFWQERLDLFRDIEAALGEDPAAAHGQALEARWQAQLERESGGNREVEAGLRAAWADRPNWPATVRWYMEGLVMMNSERFNRAADFLDAACGAAVPQ
jgi:hypothetical protein